MKIIAIGAVTAGGKTTIVNMLKERLPKTASLHFDDYSFEGEVEDFCKWIADGADVNVWDISPLAADIERLSQSGEYDLLLLDYPFGYKHDMLKGRIDRCIFIDTPLDIALARRVLRDMEHASLEDILDEMRSYLSYARTAYVYMRENPSSDDVIDGSQDTEAIALEALKIIQGVIGQRNA